ncbi:succinylglutamate desuccinylase/aspartoacylase domain-containing protein [Alteromonas aestuariivivens]|uniref:succinylglutamate desuccinylase/aspartoacylase domain-containing protein n=1 Tax=Alteromonas aestuariivivens TaxID=1938339 RepID=UPI0015F29B0E|nr:succinylglutamate desuccinylase/aspartoacylase family protein [Alteromonas aestuariivivens]
MAVNTFLEQPRHIKFKPGQPVEPDPLRFLHQLEGFTVVDISGRDTGRWRVITTLIHGNEPSGFLALHRWLKTGCVPSTNVRLIFCNVEGALAEPLFSQRFVNDDADLNRYFDTADERNPVARRAGQIKELITKLAPEWCLDMHNTSGSSPSFAVSVHQRHSVHQLAAYFTRHLIVTDTRVGALMELAVEFPVVTIECGGAHQEHAHQLAFDGISRLLDENALAEVSNADLYVYRNPYRVELQREYSADFENFQLITADFTLRRDVESLNSGAVTAGEFIGWFSGAGMPFRVNDANGNDRSGQLFYREGNRVFCNVSMQIFMATTNREIATRDCLFYCAPL